MKKHKLSDQFLMKVASGITKNNTIRALDISSNRFGIDGVAVIMACLKTNTTLESLNMSDNNIGHSEAELIANALCNKAIHLKELKMSRNDLHDHSAAVICRGVVHKRIGFILEFRFL